MKRMTFAWIAITAALLAGCWQKSAHPFYTARDLAPDERLIGTWEESKDSGEDKQRWIFTQGTAQNYNLEIWDEKEKKYQY